MLKLTNSFYRCIWFACDKTHIRRLPYLYSHRATCGADYSTLSLTAPIHTSVQCHKQKGQGKKSKNHTLKKALGINDSNNNKPMTDQLQPTSNHVSYGGNFEVVSGNEDPAQEWRRQSSQETSLKQASRTAIPPDFRVWENVNRKSHTNDGSKLQFKVLSYNVLAQYLLEGHPYLYTECGARNLKWHTRASRLFDEIVGYEPDILCFQEVQASHLNSFYVRFEKIGYCGVFKQKTGHRQDGCAIYYKRSLFDLKEHVGVEFYQPELPILNRDNVGMMVKLIPREQPCSPFVVATTHLLYNPKRTDVRLAQMQVLLAEIDRFAYYDNGSESGHLPIILTGDFNSTPESPVIKLLERGQICASSLRDNSDWKRIGVTDNCQHLAVCINRQEGRPTDARNIKLHNSEHSETSEPRSSTSGDEFSELFNSDVIGHPLQLHSAYDKVKSDGLYEATTYQDYWITVDYIYFSCSSTLKLVERLRLPTTTQCEVLGRLPNEKYGSDHLALAVTFELTSCRPAS